MRKATALLTTLATGAVLATAWQVGSRPQAGALPGVHVVAAAPAGGSRPAAGAVARGSNGPPTPATATTRATVVRRSVDGAVVATPFGDVQVQVIVVGHRLADVTPLHLTDANGHSRDLSAGAAPVLRREALAAQSAQIDTVSGATYTSQGYQASLQAALDAAHV